jgi:hypothetical protein
MKLIIRLSFSLLFFMHFIPAHSQNGAIKGRVFNAQNNEALPFVNIIISGKPQQGTTSDIDGNYILNNIEPGYVKLEVSALGYEKLLTDMIIVTNVHPAQYDIAMKEVTVRLETVEIKASPFTRRLESPVSLQTLSIAEIEKNPGANRDISRVLQSLPGVASSPAFRNDIIVRGGGASENRFYLDGVEIPNLNHFATQGASGGPVGIINADFVREVDFMAGAFPASRGNALSSVIEFRQVDGNRENWNFNVAVGASDLGVTADGPVTENSTILVSYRRSYLQFLFGVLGLPFLPTYNDYQLKYKWNIDKKNQLTLISIGSLDQFSLNTGIENPDEFQRYVLGYLPVNEQWSYTIGGVWRHFRKNGSDMYVVSRNMLDNRVYKYLNNIETPENKQIDYTSQEIENKFRYEGSSETGPYKLLYGAGFEYAKYLNKTFQKVFIDTSVVEKNYEVALNMAKYHAFGQATRSFIDSRLSLSLGLRIDANNYSDEMSNPFDQLSPRFSASYLLTEKVTLNYNMGRYYQLPPYTSLGYQNTAGEFVNRNNGIKYITADHFVLGAEFQPTASSRISVEGFYKIYSDYPFSLIDSISLASKGADYGVFGDEPLTPTSDGRAYGIELVLRDKSIKGFNMLMAYTLVRSEFTDYDKNYVPSAWDNKHILNFTLTRMLKKNWDIGLKWRFVGGAPYTPWDMDKSSIKEAWDVKGQGYLDYSLFNTERLKAFHQLDIRVDKEYFFDNWSLMLYLDIQNLYNFQSESQSILVNYDEQGVVHQYTDNQGVERYQLREIPSSSGTILPTVGIMVEF